MGRRAARNWAVRFALLILALMAVLGICFIVLASGMQSQVIDRAEDWPAFNEEAVRGTFNIPAEATILVAEEYKSFMVGGGYLLSFRLPDTKSPEEWLKQIVPKELAEHKTGHLRYDGSGKISDEIWIEYRPADKTYVARWDWD